jgi:signal transduction histidine kinase
LGVWTLYGVLTANQNVLFMAVMGRERETFTDVLPWALSTAWLWAMYTPLIVWLSRRLRIERRYWRSRVMVHVGFCIALHAVDVSIDRVLRPYVTDFPAQPWLATFLYQFDVNLFSYFVIVAITHAMNYYQWYRERRLWSAQLESQLARAQLQILKLQLQPHFLFNTLNAISELAHENADAADRMITRLGELLRQSLEHAGTQEVTLKQELELLKAYLDIEQTRFGDRLSIETKIMPEALEARIPNLLLQPLVENAIRHGAGSRMSAGCVVICARKQGAQLQIQIKDNGNGLPPGAGSVRAGLGLRNTRERLQQLYGGAHQFELRNAEHGGAVVRIAIPFRVGAEQPVEHALTEDGGG